MTIKLKPSWEKALATYREALAQNPQSAEVATKVKRLTQVVKEKKRNQQDKQPPKSNGSTPVPDPEPLQLDVVLEKTLPAGTLEETKQFAKEVIELAMKEWNDNNGKVDANVRLRLGKEASKETLPIVAVEKAFESPDTLNSCASFLRQYIVDSSSSAACLVVAKKSIAFPQVWKGSGTRKWKHGTSNGFFIQLETAAFRRLWFVPSAVEHGRNVCRILEPLDTDSHAVLPPLFR